MIVFIIGGNKQVYLPTQVELIRQNIVDCEYIVYVTGPVHRLQEMACSHDYVSPCVSLAELRIANDDVRHNIRFHRINAVINHIAEKYLVGKYGLILHGDCFPIATMSKEILLDNHLSATCYGLAAQWTLTTNGIGRDVTKKRNVKLWTNSLGAPQFFMPGFVHLDDYATDDEETLKKKLAAFHDIITSRLG